MDLYQGAIMLRNSINHWGSVSKFFHWLIALLVIIMLIVGISMGYLPKGVKPPIYNLHKSIGLTVLILMILRLIWRLSNPIPRFPETTPSWQVFAARLSHRWLYFIIIIMPLSGWIMSTAAGHPPDFWWIVKIDFPFIPLSKPLASFFSKVHLILAWIIIVSLIIHVLGAMKHWLINKDHVLQRMLPWGKTPRF